MFFFIQFPTKWKANISGTWKAFPFCLDFFSLFHSPFCQTLVTNSQEFLRETKSLTSSAGWLSQGWMDGWWWDSGAGQRGCLLRGGPGSGLTICHHSCTRGGWVAMEPHRPFVPASPQIYSWPRNAMPGDRNKLIHTSAHPVGLT